MIRIEIKLSVKFRNEKNFLLKRNENFARNSKRLNLPEIKPNKQKKTISTKRRTFITNFPSRFMSILNLTKNNCIICPKKLRKSNTSSNDQKSRKSLTRMTKNSKSSSISIANVNLKESVFDMKKRSSEWTTEKSLDLRIKRTLSPQSFLWTTWNTYSWECWGNLKLSSLRMLNWNRLTTSSSNECWSELQLLVSLNLEDKRLVF